MQTGNIVATRKTPVNFEKTRKELENLVKKMETGDLPLEDALQLFEKGIELTRICQQTLSNAEQKVQILMEKNGQQELAPLSNTEEEK